MHKRRIRQFATTFIACLCLLCCWPPSSSCAAQEKPKVNETLLKGVKSAFLSNFVKYTTWPKEAFENEKSPIIITVIGKDPLGNALDRTFKDKKPHGRKVEVQRVELPVRQKDMTKKEYEAAVQKAIESTQSSHLIYYTGDQRDIRRKISDMSRDGTTITVGESKSATADGLMLGLVIVEKKLRFIADFDTIKASQIKVSSRLLEVAHDPEEDE